MPDYRVKKATLFPDTNYVHEKKNITQDELLITRESKSYK